MKFVWTKDRGGEVQIGREFPGPTMNTNLCKGKHFAKGKPPIDTFSNKISAWATFYGPDLQIPMCNR